MVSKATVGLSLVALLALGDPRAAHAQFAVIDVAAITQLVQQVSTLEQQLATAESQLSQARNEYSAITGNRGMQRLLSGTVRNYLPGSFPQVSQLMAGTPGTYGALAGDVRSLLTGNAVLTPGQVGALSPTEQAHLNSARASTALRQAMARAALANSSERFASLEQLISAIGGAADQKASLDLNARIVAEQAMLENEQTKLQMLKEVAESDERARLLQARERSLADQGSLRRLPPMGL